jgi:two-component system, sensor histidine kinase ChiS
MKRKVVSSPPIDLSQKITDRVKQSVVRYETGVMLLIVFFYFVLAFRKISLINVFAGWQDILFIISLQYFIALPVYLLVKWKCIHQPAYEKQRITFLSCSLILFMIAAGGLVEEFSFLLILLQFTLIPALVLLSRQTFYIHLSVATLILLSCVSGYSPTGNLLYSTFLACTFTGMNFLIGRQQMQFTSFVPPLVFEVKKEIKQKASIEIELANKKQMLNSFLALAHEIKTPLSVVQYYLKVLETRLGYHRELSVVRAQHGRICRDVSNFFDVGRLEKGLNVYTHDTVVDLFESLDLSLTLFQTYAEQKNITVTYQLEPNLFVKADPSAISKLIENLLENAYKFTPEHGKIQCKMYADDHLIRVTVSDTGCGICAYEQTKVFSPYYQASADPAHAREGMGMGLYLVKEIVSTLKGKITVDSAPGNGTCFTITLPRHSAGHEPTVCATAYEELGFFQKPAQVNDVFVNYSYPNVLLVEDNQELAACLIEILKPSFNVFYASDGEQGILRLVEEKNRLDVILSDVKLPNLNGFEFCQYVLESAKFHHISFLFLTAKSDLESKCKGLKLGAIDYIDKPVDPDQLVHKLTSLVRRDKAYQSDMINNAFAALEGLRQNVVLTDENFTRTVTNQSKTFKLSDRETTVCIKLLQGFTYESIGNDLSLSINTVKTYARNIYQKTHTKNKRELKTLFQTI